MRYILVLLACLLTSSAMAEVNFIVSAQTGRFLRTGNSTANTNHEDGKYPFIGKFGIEYDVSHNLTLFSHLTHRSNIDLSEREYWYDSIYAGVRISLCVAACNKTKK